MKEVAVVGLGQIGGSIVLSFRKRHAPFKLTGIDISSKRLKLLRPVLDHISDSWSAAINADLTILCLHYEQTRKFLQQALPDRLLMDVCSGKSKLMRLANRKKLRFIGAHPMAGNEFAGEKGWREDLFQSAPFFLCPGTDSLKEDLKTVYRIVRILGGRPKIVDPDKHDRFMSTTSHFPAFLSSLIKERAQDIPAVYQGPGFRSMIRLAATSPALLDTFANSNRVNVVREAEELRKSLDRFLRAYKKA